MDPQACLNEIEDLVRQMIRETGEQKKATRQEIVYRAESLLNWIAIGGFRPECPIGFLEYSVSAGDYSVGWKSGRKGVFHRNGLTELVFLPQ